MTAQDPRPRLFFALWPDPELAAYLDALVPAGEGRAGHQSDLHLTVLFLGQTPESLLPALTAGASQLRLAAIRQPLKRIECWPTPGVLCIAGDPVPSLGKLRHELKELAHGLGLDCPVAHEEFRPHVTLRRSYRAAALVPPAIGQSLVLAADRFCLAESIPSEGDRRYRSLASWPLA